MEKIDSITANITKENIDKLIDVFPQVATEIVSEYGQTEKAIDFDVLRELLGDVVDGQRERYQFTWPGKREAQAEARRPINKTMIPCPEKSVDWDTTQNLYIEGDNLDALKLLRETYAGKISFIYVDPPYNTGSDFIYRDNFVSTSADYKLEDGEHDAEGGRLVTNSESNGRFHSDWCSMMYPRLLLARDLLTSDGMIAISIDCNESSSLKKILDEIFGRKNFISRLAIENNPKGRKNNKFVSESFEDCFIYTKNKNHITEELSKKARKKFFRNLKTSGEDEREYLEDAWGKFYQSKRQVSGNNKSNELARNAKPERCFTIYYRPVDDSMCFLDEYDFASDSWILSKDGEELINKGYSRYITTNRETGAPAIPLYSKDTLIKKHAEHGLYFKQDGTIYEKERNDGQQVNSLITNKKYGFDLMTETATRYLENVFHAKNIFPNPKNIGFLRLLLSLYPSDDCLFMDMFSGSGSFAVAIFEQNALDGGHRKCISLQIDEKCQKNSSAYMSGYSNICEIGQKHIAETKERLRINGQGSEAHSDVGFRVLRIDTSNFKDTFLTPNETEQGTLFDLVDNLKDGRTAEDILFQVLPAFRIPYSAHIEELEVHGKKVFDVNHGQLLACFDVDITNDVIEEIARRKPSYAVMRDLSFKNDSAAVNFDELFKTFSPDTIRRVI